MQTFLITGADRGIGEALCREARSRGARVIAACLGDSESLRREGVEVVPGVDVTSDSSIASLAERLAGTRLDVLINNAGVVELCELGRLDFAKLRREYEVNALGPLRVTQALLGCLGEGSRVGIITSRVGSLGENLSAASTAIACPRRRRTWRESASLEISSSAASRSSAFIRGPCAPR
jgi:NAD(P)-dependent dehydrogenase (short-subunit alcohol dehydrogenase family)